MGFTASTVTVWRWTARSVLPRIQHLLGIWQMRLVKTFLPLQSFWDFWSPTRHPTTLFPSHLIHVSYNEGKYRSAKADLFAIPVSERLGYVGNLAWQHWKTPILNFRAYIHNNFFLSAFTHVDVAEGFIICKDNPFPDFTGTIWKWWLFRC